MADIKELEAEIARLRAEIESREAEMDEERRAMMFMLEDTNRSVEEMEKAQAKLKEEMEVTSHLLMIAEATAHTTDVDRLMEQVVSCGHEIMDCDICLSYLWDSETGSFRPSQAVGLSNELIPLFRTEALDMKVGFVKEAMKEREPPHPNPLPEGARVGVGGYFHGFQTSTPLPLSL